ncbi:MAG: tyrosine-type recombinase/integrase [Thermoanaerobaculia bacterium]
MVVVLWRAGLRISEALALWEGDLEPARGAMLIRRGKGGRRREVGMDEWGWQQLRPWLEHRLELPIGPLFCVLAGPTAGRPWSAPAARTQLRRLAQQAGVRRRFAPHQLRHAHAVEMAREGVALNVIQRQLGHADLGITSVYLQGTGRPTARVPSSLGRPAPVNDIDDLAAVMRRAGGTAPRWPGRRSRRSPARLWRWRSPEDW